MIRDYPQIPLILDRKHPKSRNLVVGSNELQVEFLKKELEVHHGPQTIETCDTKLVDEDIFKIKDNTILVLDRDLLDVSEDTVSRITIWSNKPVTKRSAALNCILRKAASSLHQELDKKTMDSLGDFVAYRDRDDLETLLYDTMWTLSDTKIYYKKTNLWEHPFTWIHTGDNVTRRLEYLYQEMTWFIYSQTDEWQKAKSTGCSSSKFKWLKSCKFNNSVVLKTVKALSLWKSGSCDQYQTLIKLGVIWS
jgi:hypothetical protein